LLIEVGIVGIIRIQLQAFPDIQIDLNTWAVGIEGIFDRGRLVKILIPFILQVHFQLFEKGRRNSEVIGMGELTVFIQSIIEQRIGRKSIPIASGTYLELFKSLIGGYSTSQSLIDWLNILNTDQAIDPLEIGGIYQVILLSGPVQTAGKIKGRKEIEVIVIQIMAEIQTVFQ
jgi:hypothetical protein